MFAISFIFRPGIYDDEYWYDGYQLVAAEVRGAYGDGRLPHLTSPIAKVRRPSGAQDG